MHGHGLTLLSKVWLNRGLLLAGIDLHPGLKSLLKNPDY